MKKKLLLILIPILIFLYFPIISSVKEIEVSGNHYVSKEEIIATSELKNSYLTLINKNDVLKRLMTIKLIKKIKFKQLSLTKIKILVEEKEIIMIGHIGKKIGHIDSDNELILNVSEYIDYNFPIFTSDLEANINNGVLILNLLTSKNVLNIEEISEISYDEIIGVTIFTSDGTKIYVGNNDFSEKIINLKIILEDGEKRRKKESYIDISNTKKGVVNYNL